MRKRIDFEVYKDNRLIGGSFAILKYEGHLEVIKEVYKRQGYTIKLV